MRLPPRRWVETSAPGRLLVPPGWLPLRDVESHGRPTARSLAGVGLLISHAGPVPRHHLVPQFVLRRFADENGRLRAVPRRGGEAKIMTVRRAAAETDFYELELEERYHRVFPPQHVEQLLSEIEGAADVAVRKLIGGEAIKDDDHYYLARFLAFQLVRGWSFRSDLAELATLRARHHLAATLERQRVRDHLERTRDSVDDDDVDRFIEEMLSSDWKLVPSRSHAVQLFGMAGISLIPLVTTMGYRVERFEAPLLTSDEPAALWGQPGRDLDAEPLGIATADAILFPLDRHHLLVLCHRDRVASQPRGLTATDVNLAVSAGAFRWVFQHPSDPPVDVEALPQQGAFVAEPVEVLADEDKYLVRYRTQRRG